MSQSHTTTAGPLRRGANVYLVASMVAQAAALLRYVALARLLGPEQLGLAATLVLTSAFFDMISDTGSDRFLIQDRDGDAPDVQRLVHLVYIGRGAMIAVGLAVFAWPIALVYRAPELAAALAILALSPLILGFQHLDFRRFQRHLDFRAEAVCMIAGESCGLIATVVAAWLTHHFTAILYGLITRAVVMVAASHFRSHRTYAVGFARAHAARLSRFAAPLMLNGLLLFFATQGDRAMVGNRLGFVALGRYSAILLLIYYPASMLLRYMQAMYLPVLARGRDDPVERGRVGAVMGGQVLMLGLAMSAGFALVAPLAVRILYGAKFAESAVTVGLIGILQSSRFLLVFPGAVALSVGRSATVLTVNIVRLAAYPAAFLGGLVVGGLPGVVGGFIVGEFVANASSLVLLNRGFQRPLLSGFDRLVVFVLGSACILGWAQAVEVRDLGSAAILSIATVALVAWIIRRERVAIRESLAIAARVTRGLTARLSAA